MLRLTWFLLCVILCSHQELLSQVIDLRGNWKFHIGDHSTWSAATFDDSKWKLIEAPSYWEDQGFNGYDGFAWYRKIFDGTKLDKNKTYYLDMGYIDDTDEVYLNGRLIGFEGTTHPFYRTAFNKHRKYIIPAEAINFNDENVIAVRVFDAALGGGIMEGKLGIYESQANKFLLYNLQGVWSLTTDRSQKEQQKIMVPSFWELTQPNFNRVRWYKRTFTIQANIPNDQLMLLAGKIDDFDEVYLNNVLIGKTNDQLPFGPSKSYLKQRVYPIPASALNKTGVNTIEIRVEDIGLNGGIYDGILGIVTRKDFEKYVGF